MRKVAVLAGVALASLLAGCSPAASSDADEKSFRAETAAQAKPVDEPILSVTDAAGNELDPELADAVRAKMEQDKAELAGADTGDAPADTTVPAAAETDEN